MEVLVFFIVVVLDVYKSFFFSLFLGYFLGLEGIG